MIEHVLKALHRTSKAARSSANYVAVKVKMRPLSLNVRPYLHTAPLSHRHRHQEVPKRLVVPVKGLNLKKLSELSGLSLMRLQERFITINECNQTFTPSQDITDEEALRLLHAFHLEAKFIFEVSQHSSHLYDYLDKTWPRLHHSHDPLSRPLRPPIVTIMGHVDHGKTTLLDYLRKSAVAPSEAGGITQHIGAFSVALPGYASRITFLDTPGHAAFSQMRHRGAHLTDIVILVVAADDGVMPQTVESIKYAKESDVPMIVAINKCDKFESNADKIKRDLVKYDILVEEMGGDTQAVPISGLTVNQGKNVDLLLQSIIALSEMVEPRAAVDGPVSGTIIESRQVPGKGPTSQVLVREGTLRHGASLISNQSFCKVKQLTDSMGKVIKEAGPSTPVEILGWKTLPIHGDEVVEVASEHLAHELIDDKAKISDHRRFILDNRATMMHKASMVSMRSFENSTAATKEEKFHDYIANKFVTKEEFKMNTNELNLILFCDVLGSIEAIKSAILGIECTKVRPVILKTSVGEATAGDVDFADMTKSKIVMFNVKPSKSIKALAEQRKVDMRTHSIIYRLTDDVTSMLTHLLPTSYTEKIAGSAEITRTFDIDMGDSTAAKVAGAIVDEGYIKKDAASSHGANSALAEVRILRGSKVIYANLKIRELKHLKKDVTMVSKGTECGILFEDSVHFREGDTVQYILRTPSKKVLC